VATGTETFFLPDELSRETTRIPAALYNRCRLLLARYHYQHIFVPIRPMQYLAVIDEQEIIFVDSQAYAVRDSEGGRLIMLAWRFKPGSRPASLTEPVPIDVVYYHAAAKEAQRRLQGEFIQALDILEVRAKQVGMETKATKVLPFRS
jgi:hypothetical protein